MKPSRERIVVVTVATVEVIAVAAVVLAAEIATNASRGGKMLLRGKVELGKRGNRVFSLPTYPISLSPCYFLPAGVSFNFNRSLPRMISTSYS